MKVTVEYTGQLRAALGRVEEEIELPGGSGWTGLFQAIAERHGGEARERLLNAGGEPDGVLCFAGDEQVDWAEPPDLADGARVTIMSAISGG